MPEDLDQRLKDILQRSSALAALLQNGEEFHVAAGKLTANEILDLRHFSEIQGSLQKKQPRFINALRLTSRSVFVHTSILSDESKLLLVFPIDTPIKTIQSLTAMPYEDLPVSTNTPTHNLENREGAECEVGVSHTSWKEDFFANYSSEENWAASSHLKTSSNSDKALQFESLTDMSDIVDQKDAILDSSGTSDWPYWFQVF